MYQVHCHKYGLLQLDYMSLNQDITKQKNIDNKLKNHSF